MSDRESSDNEEAPYTLPSGLEFDFVDTAATAATINDNEVQPDKEEEFYFPLFATDSNNKALTDTAGQPKTDEPSLFKVTLKEELDYEPIIQSRPSSYYFPSFSEEEIKQFQSSAVSYDDVFAVAPDNRWTYKTGKPRNLVDLKDYNNEVEALQKLLKRQKRRRPSLKNRKNKIEAKKNVKARKNADKQVERRKIKYITQKKKRGGKKNRKKKQNDEKPKYKTE